MTVVTIYLEFEDNDIDDADVYNYVQELIDNQCLGYHISYDKDENDE